MHFLACSPSKSMSHKETEAYLWYGPQQICVCWRLILVNIPVINKLWEPHWIIFFSNLCSSNSVSQRQHAVSLDCDHRCCPFFPHRPLVVSYYPGAHNICVQVSFSSLSFNWVLADLNFLCPLALFFSPGVVTIRLCLCHPLPIHPSPFWGLKQCSPQFLVIATLTSLCPTPPCSLPFAYHSQWATFDVLRHAVPLSVFPPLPCQHLSVTHTYLHRYPGLQEWCLPLR